MGTERFFKLGSFYRICDRTGFAVRADRTQLEWNNLMVDRRVWEARQPQDYVRGINDDQTVPYARPRQPNPLLGMTTSPQFQVFGDLPTGSAFEVQAGKINVIRASAVVTASSYPSGF